MCSNRSTSVLFGYQSPGALPLIVRKNRRGTWEFGMTDLQYNSPHLYLVTLDGNLRSPCTISLERDPLEGDLCFTHSLLRSLALPIMNDPQLGRCNNHPRHGKLLPTSSSDCSLPAHDSTHRQPGLRRGARVAESGSLENCCRGNSTVGSIPTLSAIIFKPNTFGLKIMARSRHLQQQMADPPFGIPKIRCITYTSC